MKPKAANNFLLKLKDEDKHLGQIIGSNLATSALSTVKDISKNIKGAALEVKRII